MKQKLYFKKKKKYNIIPKISQYKKIKKYKLITLWNELDNFSDSL
jgi:hypothetical protein